MGTSGNNWICKSWDEVTKEELYAFTQLRMEVFVIEQDCPYPEFDGKDQRSWHLWAEKDGAVVAYLRIVEAGVSYEEISIGRVVVAKSARGSDLGVELMKQGINFIQKEIRPQPIRISAQQYLKGWYGRLGFEQVSEMYLEDDIPHIEMLYTS